MATFNVLTDAGFDMTDPDFYSVANALPGDTSQFGWIAPDGTFWLATGVGFTYGPDGLPVTGVITGLMAMNGGNLIAQASGLSVSASFLMTAGMSDFYGAIMPGDDSMSFGDGDDIIEGTPGADDIHGGAGSDTLNWREGDGNDYFDGGTGEFDTAAVEISGSWRAEMHGDDRVRVRDLEVQGGEHLELKDVEILKVSTVESGQDNTIVFGDFLHKGLDYIVFEGGTGADHVDFEYPVKVRTYIDGGDGDDVLNGGRVTDHILGGAGDDIIAGNKGDDELDGGAGDDFIDGGLGDDTILGGAGDDALYWRDGGGDDTIDGGADFDVLDLRLTESSRVNVQASGDDVLLAANGNYETLTLRNIEEVDINRYGSADVTVGDLSGTTMADSRFVFHDVAGDDVFDGGASSNPLTFVRELRGTGQYNDIDIFIGGGSDKDLLFLNGSHAVSTSWTLSSFFGLLAASDAHSGDAVFARDIEMIEMELEERDDTVHVSDMVAAAFDGTIRFDGGAGDDTLTADAGVMNDITFDDAAGNDTATTGSGNDTFVYRDGMDSYDGGDGTDTASFEEFGSAVFVNLNMAGTEAWTRDGPALSSGTWRAIADLANIENVTGTHGSDYFGGDENDNVYAYVGADGSGGLDFFAGRGGVDTIDFSGFDSAVQVDLMQQGLAASTRDGDDLSSGAWRDIAYLYDVENVVGTEKSDHLSGSEEDNVFGYVGEKGTGGLDGVDGRGGTDTVDFSGFDAAVSVDLNASGAEARTRDGDDLGSGAWRDIADLVSIENIVGTAGSDHFAGDSADNTYSYFGENGSGGLDTAYGGGGVDRLDFSMFDAAVWVDLDPWFGPEAWTRDGAGLDQGDWRQIAFADGFENVSGSAFDDRLAGDAFANRLDGGAGDDLLIGEGGDDTFVFSHGSGDDMIHDFSSGDVIEIDVDGFDSFADIAGSMSQGGDGLVIDFGQDGSLTLAGLSHFDVDQNDFVFV